MAQDARFDDPLARWQRHLGTIRLDQVPRGIGGRGVRIAVLDDGIDPAHPELAPAYDWENDLDVASGAEDGRPRFGGPTGDRHGTAVAGIAAARGDDGIGVRGVAHLASLLSIRMPFLEIEAGLHPDRPEDYARAFARATRAEVANNSWGDSTGLYSVHDPLWRPLFEALREGVRGGRGGLGTVFLFAAGNERGLGLDVNYSNLTNLHETITVAATTVSGSRVASYSTPGASILIAAPAAAVTTDRPGLDGYNDGRGEDFSDPDYTRTFTGTSAATPVVSGVVALMLEAEPGLGYRDVKEILAASARRLASADDWQRGAGTFWNGGAMATSHDLGAGLVDAAAAVRVAQTWLLGGRAAQTEADLVVHSVTGRPVGGGFLELGSPVEIRFMVDGSMIERVQEIELDLSFTHSYLHDLRITLTSSSGVESVLLDRPPTDPAGFAGVVLGPTWRFGSTQHWGEHPQGLWILRIEDLAPGDAGRVDGASLHLFGPAPSEDDRWVFTDDAARFGPLGELVDTAGMDVLDLAAISRGVRVDLEPGSTSSIAGARLRIAPNTIIETVIGGAGDDRLFGNAVDNTIWGGAGKDRLAGRAGDDLLRPGPGDDRVDGGPGVDTLWLSGPRANYELVAGRNAWIVRDLFGDDGVDRVAGVERIRFTDGTFDLDALLVSS